jgi:signal transduction histidine kinase
MDADRLYNSEGRFAKDAMTPDALPVPAAHSPSPATLRGWRLTLARVVWAVCASLAIALFVAFIPLNWYGVPHEWQVQSGFAAVARYVHLGAFANYVLALRYSVSMVSFGVAALIVWRKSDDAVALMVALGLILLPTTLVSVDGAGRIYPIYGPPWHALLQSLRDWLAFLAIHYTVFLFFIFPDGRFAPRWMKWATWGVLVLFGLVFGLSYGWTSWEVWFMTFIAWLVLAMGSQIYRYLRLSGPTERQQTKWFVAAVAFGPIWLLVSLFGIAPGLSESQANLIGLHLLSAWLLFLPLGVGIGVLRRGLWGADPIINRTLVYGALTMCVILLYVVSVGGLSALFQSSGSVALSALVTGAIAVLFQPLRQWLQRLVNRLMYGDRDDPATVLARLGQRLETALAPEAVLSLIAETLAQALKVPYAAIELVSDGRVQTLVSYPASTVGGPPAEALRLPLVYQSEAIGQLIIAPRAPGEAFTPADRRLLEQIAHQAGPAAHAVRLTADLHRSRERIIVAREEERRRLRRDLHDGLGPTLASQTFKLDAVLDWLDRDPAAARQLLGEVKAQTQATVADIRRLVYELRPPALDELGLAGALRAHVQSLPPANGLRVSIEAPPELPPLSAAVEVAAYRIALEALTNVVRHAHAQACSIRLAVVPWRNRDFLSIEVTDDGVGLTVASHLGVGLVSMRERAEELGGTCVIDNGRRGGVTVVAQLPLPQP